MKVFITAQTHYLKDVVTNKQKLWKKILETLNICENELLNKNYHLVVITYPNWTKDFIVNTEGAIAQNITRMNHIYPILKKNKNIKIIDSRDEENSMVVWEREVE
jgi:hypothetical protein